MYGGRHKLSLIINQMGLVMRIVPLTSWLDDRLCERCYWLLRSCLLELFCLRSLLVPLISVIVIIVGTVVRTVVLSIVRVIRNV